MKEWAKDHPKAKAMARKRALILSAARAVFLQSGYSGASMDAIAQAADVSLMTLYRHAESKDDLLAAVVASACDPNDDEERRFLEGMMERPLDEVLCQAAVNMQEILIRPDTIALMRLVIAEAASFPHLTELAYQGFVVHLEEFAAWIVEAKSPPGTLGPGRSAAVARTLVDRVVGRDFVRVLLGQPVPSEAEKRSRAEAARDDALRELAAGTI